MLPLQQDLVLSCCLATTDFVQLAEMPMVCYGKNHSQCFRLGFIKICFVLWSFLPREGCALSECFGAELAGEGWLCVS